MNRRKLKLFLSLSVSVLVLAIWGFLEPERSRVEPRPDYLGEVDAYVTNARVKQFDQSGRLTHRVSAERLRHLPDTGVTLLDQPLMTVYRQNRDPITAKARFGELEANNDIFWLREDALVFNMIDRRYRLEAPELKITPDKELVETETPVIIRQPTGVTHGIGMTADLANDKIKLHNAVRGTYETN
ncbi:LPS export ABC transporter periplasmic protein LptC [Motiliproteus sp.]|uniref:LPS export ABC transporter periplasmic protein LptC n=1 Tax=Motiliproteus sp. TaxID=1898955 RepID=UPI003BAC8DB7